MEGTSFSILMLCYWIIFVIITSFVLCILFLERIPRLYSLFFFKAEDGIRDTSVTGVQTCALPISKRCASSRRPLPRYRADRCASPRAHDHPIAQRPDHHHQQRQFHAATDTAILRRG